MAKRMWEKPPMPAVFRVYIFNITNPEEVSNGEKAKIKEVGPYVYDQWREKIEVKEEANDTLSFRKKATMVFNRKKSGCRRESDFVTVPNLPLIGLVFGIEKQFGSGMLEYLSDIWPLLFPGLKNVFITSTVKNILFDGITIDCSSGEGSIDRICDELLEKGGHTLRKDGKNIKFALLNHKNQTSKERFRMYRGIQDFQNLQKTHSIDNRTVSRKKTNKTCDVMQDGDQTYLPVNVLQNNFVNFTPSYVCRSPYVKDGEHYRDGIQLYRFAVTTFKMPGEEESEAQPPDPPVEDKKDVKKVSEEEKDEKNQEKNQEEKDEENQEEKDEENQEEKDEEEQEEKAGSKVEEKMEEIDEEEGENPGGTVFFTFPYYYLANESFSNYTGLKPVKELHQTYADIEPSLGTPISVHRRAQMNVEIRKMPGVPVMENLSLGIIPILWIDGSIDLDDDSFQSIKAAVQHIKLLKIITYVLICLGIFMIVIACLFYAKKQKILWWEPVSSTTSQSPKVQDYDKRNFKIDGIYKDKFQSTTPTSLFVPVTARFNNVYYNSPAAIRVGEFSRYQRNYQALHKPSLLVSYKDHFM